MGHGNIFADFIGFFDLMAVMTLSLMRLGSFMLVFPPLNKSFVTGMARNTVILSLSAPVFPTVYNVYTQVGRTYTTYEVMLLLMKESFLGMFLGFFAGLIFEAVMSAGAFVDNQRGTNMASVFDPLIGEQSSLFGILLSQFTMIVFFAAGFFIVCLGIFYDTFEVWPVMDMLPLMSYDFPHIVLTRMDEFMDTFLVISASMIVVMFLIDLGFGLLNRFAPALDVFFVSMSVKSEVSLLVLMLSLYLLIYYLETHHFRHQDWFQFVQTLF